MYILADQKNSLLVDNADVLADFPLSLTNAAIPEAKQSWFRSYVSGHLNSTGGKLEITQDAGMVSGRKYWLFRNWWVLLKTRIPSLPQTISGIGTRRLNHFFDSSSIIIKSWIRRQVPLQDGTPCLSWIQMKGACRRASRPFVTSWQMSLSVGLPKNRIK